MDEHQIIDLMNKWLIEHGKDGKPAPQRLLAQKLGCSEFHVNRWLNGKVVPRRLWIEEIERVLTKEERGDYDKS